MQQNGKYAFCTSRGDSFQVAPWVRTKVRLRKPFIILNALERSVPFCKHGPLFDFHAVLPLPSSVCLSAFSLMWFYKATDNWLDWLIVNWHAIAQALLALGSMTGFPETIRVYWIQIRKAEHWRRLLPARRQWESNGWMDVQGDPCASGKGYVDISSASYWVYPEMELMST